MRLFGLIGQPLTHSFSKKYFSEKFEREGLSNCRYELFPLAAITELPALLKQYPALEGLNVTIPYKKQVLSFLDAAENIPPALEACNCIRIHKAVLIGYNTDTVGFEKSLRPLLKVHHTNALILGNGGATAAIGFVLHKLGIPFRVISRERTKTTLTYSELTEGMIREAALIINTTPLGMYPDTLSCPDIPYPFISERHLLYDLVYNPAKTLFLQKGEERGATIKNGEEMLRIQAEESWRIWNESGGGS